MEKINGRLICVVEYKAGVYGNGPSYLQYDSPDIVRTTPCLSRDGKFFDLRTGKEYVPKRKSVTTWNITPGNVLFYPDGQKILVTRELHGERNVFIKPISDDEYHPTSMVLRRLVNRPEKV